MNTKERERERSTEREGKVRVGVGAVRAGDGALVHVAACQLVAMIGPFGFVGLDGSCRDTCDVGRSY